MLKKILFLKIGFGVSLLFANPEDSLTNCALLPDPILEAQEKAKGLQEKIEEINKGKIKEMMENLKEQLKKVPLDKELRIPEKVLLVERFDDTGLVRDNIKYFIRIWKHPPREKFNMPTFKLR